MAVLVVLLVLLLALVLAGWAIGRGRYGRSPAGGPKPLYRPTAPTTRPPAGGPKPLYRPTAPTTRPRAGRAGDFRVAAADESLAGLLDRADVVVIDTETTGVGARSEVLDVAIIDTTGRVLLDAVSLPQGAIRREVSNMHGLTRDRLRKMGARPWPEVHREVCDALRGVTWAVAWNAEYDRRLLQQTAERHGLTLPRLRWRCAMMADVERRGPGARRAKLSDAARRYGVTVRPTHRAMADARATLDVLRALASA